jgi:hypothetical protein
MSEQPKTVGEEWRAVRGWVPWLLAGVYFPLYVGLDLVAGGTLASQTGLPRSVSVAGCSLAVAVTVTAVVTVSKLESVSLSRAVDALDPRSSVANGGRSRVGASGGVNRKTAGTPTPPTPTDGDGGSGTPDPSPDGGTDGEETDGEDWPEDWIPANEL